MIDLELHGLVGNASVRLDFVNYRQPASVLTHSVPNPLSVSRNSLAATTVGNFALFGGGFTAGGVSSAVVDAYDTALTRTTPTALSVARHVLAATTVGNFALFGGGFTAGSVSSAVVDAYDTALTRTTPTALSAARDNLAATTVGNFALFGGGLTAGSVSSAVVDAYNTTLTRTNPTPLSSARFGLAATTVGDFALFGGGTALVDAYNGFFTHCHFPLTTSSTYDVGGGIMTAASNFTLQVVAPVNGWIRYRRGTLTGTV